FFSSHISNLNYQIFSQSSPVYLFISQIWSSSAIFFSLLKLLTSSSIKPLCLSLSSFLFSSLSLFYFTDLFFFEISLNLYLTNDSSHRYLSVSLS
ncbi:unnamed protein product, partial [Brassica oleracea var. botrytis]